MIRKFLLVVRQVVNAGWRPAACVCFVGSLFVNGVWLPIVTLTPANMATLATLVGAVVAAFAVREVGKRWGTSQ